MTPRTETEPSSTAVRRQDMFGSLRSRNFRLMEASYLLSNSGYWMGLNAQSWLVLRLTGSAADVGLTAAIQFSPMLVLGMAGGMLADRYPKRRILVLNYAVWTAMMGLLAGLTLSHVVQIWQIQLLAAGFGIVDALSYPARQAFVSEMVGPTQLRNAISINSGQVQLAALVGPAIGGLLIGAVGSGGSFLVAALGHTVPLVALTRVRAHELHRLPSVQAEPGQLRASLRYALSRPDILWPTVLIGLYGTFTGNISVTLAVYAKSVFDSGPSGYGLLSATVAIGSLIGALISTRLHHTRLRTLVVFAVLLSALYILAAAAPTQLIFFAVLLGVGASTLLLQTSTNSTVQLASHASIRGRIISIYALVWFAGIAIGGPLVGNLDQYLGPRAGMLLAGVLPGIATVLIAARLTMHLRRSRRSAIE